MGKHVLYYSHCTQMVVPQSGQCEKRFKDYPHSASIWLRLCSRVSDVWTACIYTTKIKPFKNDGICCVAQSTSQVVKDEMSLNPFLTDEGLKSSGR